MIITKMAMGRRTVLRGMGTALALPLLDAMVPALTASSRSAAKPTLRFGAIYVPMGVIMDQWTPKSTGPSYEMTPILQPIEKFRSQLTVASGLDNASLAGSHPGATTAFLTDMRGETGATQTAGVSMDQLVARVIGQDNRLPSLELGLEDAVLIGDCENTACGYLNTLAYSAPTTPLPVECNPRVVFERLFGDPEITTTAARQARIRHNRSLLDSLSDDVAALQRRVGTGDRRKVSEYLEAVREVERRIQKAEAESASSPEVTIQPPNGIPAEYADHARLMFDLQVLAFQSDVTRVVTNLMEREFSSRRFPEIGVNEPHHSTTHHPDPLARMEPVSRINTYQVSLFAYLLEKLAATPDGDGSLLDHSILIYGSGMSDGNLHSPKSLPLVLAGGGAGSMKGGRHVDFGGIPLANLHLTLMDKFGVNVEKLGNSTGRLDQAAGV